MENSQLEAELRRVAAYHLQRALKANVSCLQISRHLNLPSRIVRRAAKSDPDVALWIYRAVIALISPLHNRNDLRTLTAVPRG